MTKPLYKPIRLEMGGVSTIGQMMLDTSQLASQTGVSHRTSYVLITEDGKFVLNWELDHLTKARRIHGKACYAMLKFFTGVEILRVWFQGVLKEKCPATFLMQHVTYRGYWPQKSALQTSKLNETYKTRDIIAPGTLEEFEVALRKATSGSGRKEDLVNAQMLAARDIYPTTISLFKKANELESEPEAYGEVLKAFAVETMTKTKLEIERVSKADLKKGKRRKQTIDWVKRELAENWFKKGYAYMNAEELAKAINSVTGKSFSPQAIKKVRERLGLATEINPGLPNEESKKKREQFLS